MQISTSGPRAKGIKWSTLRVWRSKINVRWRRNMSQNIWRDISRTIRRI